MYDESLNTKIPYSLLSCQLPTRTLFPCPVTSPVKKAKKAKTHLGNYNPLLGGGKRRGKGKLGKGKLDNRNVDIKGTNVMVSGGAFFIPTAGVHKFHARCNHDYEEAAIETIFGTYTYPTLLYCIFYD